MKKGVSYQQLRSATGKVIYNETTFLIDPMLAEKDATRALPERSTPR